MTFENLQLEIRCDCLQNTFEDYVSVYARKINKETPKESD